MNEFIVWLLGFVIVFATAIILHRFGAFDIDGERPEYLSIKALINIILGSLFSWITIIVCTIIFIIGLIVKGLYEIKDIAVFKYK